MSNSLLNPKFNTLRVVRGIDLGHSGLTNVSSINGSIVSPSGLEPNLVNVIFKQNAPIFPGSNIVGLWSDVVAIANKINVNQTINVFFDDSLSSPCLINVSYDFKGRCNFFSSNVSITQPIVKIVDTYTVSNVHKIDGIKLLCDSITTQSLNFNQVLNVENNSIIDNTVSALVSSIVLDNSTNILKLHHLSILRNTGNPAVSLIRLINNAQLSVYNNFNNVTVSSFNNAISDDGTGTLTIYSDASWLSFPTFASFTGTYNKIITDKSKLISYDDTKTPAFGTTNVQDSLDYLKQNYALSNSTNSLTAGSTSVSSLNDSGLTASQVVATDASKNLISSGYSITDFLKSSLVFGDGSDGAVTYSDGLTHTLTKHMYYTTLTLTNSSIIQTASYRIFASVAITGDGTGTIKAGGFDASGQTGGTAINNSASFFGYLGIELGSTGGAVNTNGSTSGQFAQAFFGACTGGHGGNSDTKVGGSPTSVIQPLPFTFIQSILKDTIGFMNINNGIGFFANGGASGAGGSVGVGGGGGGGGGCSFVIAKSIGSVTLSAKGGKGGNATGLGGVGGGGNGGLVFAVYQTATGGFSSANFTSAGGLMGSVGNTTSATNGDPGLIQLTQLI